MVHTNVKSTVEVLTVSPEGEGLRVEREVVEVRIRTRLVVSTRG